MSARSRTTKQAVIIGNPRGQDVFFEWSRGRRVSPPQLYSKSVADHRSKASASFLGKMRQNPHCSVNLRKPD